MRTVGLKVLKNRRSEYVRLASQGERVLIADRDRVVAELVPPEPGRAERVSDAVLVGLVREGLVTPACRRDVRSGAPRSAPPSSRTPCGSWTPTGASGDLPRHLGGHRRAPGLKATALFLQERQQEVALVTYDERMAEAARALGLRLASP